MLSSELVIVRHPQASCEVAGIVGGQRGDAGLTLEGRALAASTAIEMLCEEAEQPYGVVYTGGQPRLRETAKIVSAVLGVRMLGEAALACHRYGHDIDARPWTEVIAELGGSPRSLPDLKLGRGGESTTRCLLRLRNVLERLTNRHPGQRVVVIGDSAHVDASLLLFLGGSESSSSGGSDCAPGWITRWREQPDPGQIQASGVGWKLVHHGPVHRGTDMTSQTHGGREQSADDQPGELARPRSIAATTLVRIPPRADQGSGATSRRAPGNDLPAPGDRPGAGSHHAEPRTKESRL